MKRTGDGRWVFSPSDLITYSNSPFASWMDRYSHERPGEVFSDEESEDQQLIAKTGDAHELAVLQAYKDSLVDLVEVSKASVVIARAETRAAFALNPTIIYQAYLEDAHFAGYSDFLIHDADGKYQVWDTKLANSPKPYYAIQLCCYSEMLAYTTGVDLPTKFGIILGTKEQVEFRVEDFLYYYWQLKSAFLEMHENFQPDLAQRPEPLPRANHGKWSSYAERYFTETDHLVQVAGITVGQMKKLRNAGIHTMTELAAAEDRAVPKLAEESRRKLAAQASLQVQTNINRRVEPAAPPAVEILPPVGASGQPVGLAALPPAHDADVFFDMEGYPLVQGGLEYLFGVWILDPDSPQFLDWWGHDRGEEKQAFEGFIDWVYARWKAHPGLHIYHYAAYEVSAVRRLSTRHDTRQEEVDILLRNNVFVDLYQVVRHGLRIGEDSYSIKRVERLYRPKRSTDVANAVDSIVQYARWIETCEPKDWHQSPILKGIRDYNEDDCSSTADLLFWLRQFAINNGIAATQSSPIDSVEEPTLPEEILARQRLVGELRAKGDGVSTVLADLIGFHRRENKPVFWKMFDRAIANPEDLREDPSCIEGIKATGERVVEKKSWVQTYKFDPDQECKLSPGEKSTVMFPWDLDSKFKLVGLDMRKGELQLKIGMTTINGKFGGDFPKTGSLIPYEVVESKEIANALTAVAEGQLDGNLHAPTSALLWRKAPSKCLRKAEESPTEAAIRVVREMVDGCLVIQGPPGTGKTYTASHMIAALLAEGKKVGVCSNSHKAIGNLLAACGKTMQAAGTELVGIKAAGEKDETLHESNPGLHFVAANNIASEKYTTGVVGGTAWLFSRPEWIDGLDVLFIDEAGQVSLANAVAISRCARNLVLLGDQMQLEQPVQGSHPGDAGLSVLQYALKDTKASAPDAPVFHAVVPADFGIFLGETRRMHPSVCSFISDSIYEGRLGSHSDCERQHIADLPDEFGLEGKGAGIAFLGIEHDGDVQRSDEEIAVARRIVDELLGKPYTDKRCETHPLELKDFMFISPYNAQVRGLESALPAGAKVGSVDRFQGQEAPVCILSLCSSYGEYGARGLAFILDKNRINVAISRAQCLAIVIADPRIAQTSAGSIEEMQLVNLFCKLNGMADSESAK